MPDHGPPLFPPASLDLLTKRTNMNNFFINRNPITEPDQELSILDIIRMAGAKFIDSSTQPAAADDSSSDEATSDVDLIHHLLRAADELDRKNHEQATHLLDLCDCLSSKTGNLAQRLTHYFVSALREKIRNETGTATHPLSDLINVFNQLNIEETLTAASPLVQILHEKIPFFQIGQLAGVQAIVESVEKSKKIHIIDLRIRNGMQWTALMQALSSPTKRKRRRSNPEMLKITAVVTASENLIRGAGERLAKFAESMKIPFTFNVIVVQSLIEIDESQFQIDPKETVAVFGEYALKGLISKAGQLESLMSVVKKIRPAIMVVIESEASLNSSNFGRRFVEVLFHYGAYFDCMDTCLESDGGGGGGGGERGLTESMFLSESVRELLVKEGEEMERAVTVDVWRRFFSRYWMWEMGLSSSAMVTVNLLLGRFAGGECCTLDLDGRSLVVGWKGTPIFSISTWKFLNFRSTERNPETESET